MFVALLFVSYLATVQATACVVDSLILWNADTNEPIDSLNNLGNEIDICDYKKTGLNLEVTLTCEVNRVEMTLTDDATGEEVVSQTESAEPYMLGGDINDPFDVNTLDALKIPGTYKLTVHPRPGSVETFYFSVTKCPFVVATAPTEPARMIQANEDYKQHYLVGLLNYPNSAIPDILNGVTSGVLIGQNYSYVPSVGFSDIEQYYNEDNGKINGEYFCLSDNGYGSSTNSEDYALNIVHMRIQKPFSYRHGESTFEKYTETENLNTALIHDPYGYIKWENGADIQVTYAVPDSTWDTYKSLRVLTGRDFDVEGLAVLNHECAIIGDELMPAIFAVNPTTGVVMSNFVRTPDIDADGSFNGKFLSTRGDKVHCTIEDLEANVCKAVDSSVVDASEYRKHDPSGGYEGFSVLSDGSIAAFVEKQTGDTTLGDEPGIRVYRVDPGDCYMTPPSFTEFLGYYPFELNAGNIADTSTIPGSDRRVLVIERNGFPRGYFFPSPVMPANKVCIVDILDVDENMVMQNKKCILNYHDIDDPWDVDGNGILKYAQTQVTNEALVVVDDYCIVAGTDTNFPSVNQFQLPPEEVPFFQEVSDTRFMVVCFLEPYFDPNYPIWY